MRLSGLPEEEIGFGETISSSRARAYISIPAGYQ
jgi:hypothetical protein